MTEDGALLEFMRAIADGRGGDVDRALERNPALATARLAGGATRADPEESFLDGCAMHVYRGDTALHVAAAAYDTDLARRLIAAGADVRARNRRGAEPIHAAAVGAPGSDHWDPVAQAEVIVYLIEAGADPDAVAAGGVTPLHRAVRNRCTGAVRALLEGGADAGRANDRGSTALDLAGRTTGRGGSGSDAAKAEQGRILDLLASTGR